MKIPLQDRCSSQTSISICNAPPPPDISEDRTCASDKDTCCVRSPRFTYKLSHQNKGQQVRHALLAYQHLHLRCAFGGMKAATSRGLYSIVPSSSSNLGQVPRKRILWHGRSIARSSAAHTPAERSSRARPTSRIAHRLAPATVESALACGDVRIVSLRCRDRQYEETARFRPAAECAPEAVIIKPQDRRKRALLNRRSADAGWSETPRICSTPISSHKDRTRAPTTSQ